MVYSLNLAPVPIRLRTLRRFEGRDPWDGGTRKGWSVSLFKLVPEQTAVSAQWAQIRPKAAVAAEEPDPVPGGRPLRVAEAIGLEADGGHHRMLPRVVHDAWSRGEVADADLPGILAGLEPELKRRDFFVAASTRAARWIAAVLLGGAAALFFGLYVFGRADSTRVGAVDPLGVGDGRVLLTLTALTLAPLLLALALLRLRDRREGRLRRRVLELRSSLQNGADR